MIRLMIRKQFFCVADVRAIGKLIPREFLCGIGGGGVTEGTLWRGPNYTKRFLPDAR